MRPPKGDPGRHPVRPDGSDEPPEVSPRTRLALLSSIGIMFPTAIAMGGAFGYYLDQRFGTFPWLLIVFLFCGVAAGFVNLFRVAKLFDRQE